MYPIVCARILWRPGEFGNYDGKTLIQSVEHFSKRDGQSIRDATSRDNEQHYCKRKKQLFSRIPLKQIYDVFTSLTGLIKAPNGYMLIR